MTSVRTAIQWLLDHQLADDAEVWILSDRTAEPVVTMDFLGSDVVFVSLPWWSEPMPTPLQWSAIYARLMGSYSGGGTFKWNRHTETFRGSYSQYPDQAVFLLFLPRETSLIESHTEIMEQRREQAKRLTQEIDNVWDS